jgi:hypothetical protein
LQGEKAGIAGRKGRDCREKKQELQGGNELQGEKAGVAGMAGVVLFLQQKQF